MEHGTWEKALDCKCGECRPAARENRAIQAAAEKHGPTKKKVRGCDCVGCRLPHGLRRKSLLGCDCIACRTAWSTWVNQRSQAVGLPPIDIPLRIRSGQRTTTPHLPANAPRPSKPVASRGLRARGRGR